VVDIRWTEGTRASEAEQAVLEAFGQATGWVEIGHASDGFRVLAAVGRRSSGEQGAEWSFEDMRGKVEQALLAAGLQVASRDEYRPSIDPAPAVWAAGEASGFEMTDASRCEKAVASRRDARCSVCGDTGVVSRLDYPDALPSPGHIDSMGRCPACQA